MAIEISDLVSHAKSQDIEESEVIRRVAIKSAYYAMYHTALEAVTQAGGIQSNDRGSWGVHAEVANAFRRIGTASDRNAETKQKSRRAARLLKDAKDLRVLACYQLDEDVSINQSKDSINLLDDFIDVAETISPDCSARDRASSNQ